MSERGTPVAVPPGSLDGVGSDMTIPEDPGCTLHAADRRTMLELDFSWNFSSTPAVWCGQGVVTTVVSGDHIGVVWSPLCGPPEQAQ